MSIKVKGQAELNSAINRVFAKNKKAAVGAVKKGLMVIIAEAVRIAPIEFGVLRNSSFTESKKTSKGVSGKAGFTAEYAPFVHEMPMKNAGKPRAGRKGFYWQGGENKFLEKAIKREMSAAMRIIQSTLAKVNK